MAYTEFCCRASGSNLNGGALSTNAEPSTTAAYTSTNGDWDNAAANKFTPTDGSTPASSITVGDFASVYIDGASTGVFIGRVTAVAAGVNGAITVSNTIKAGTKPTASATTRSIKVGGAWLGPNGTDLFPFSLGALDGLVNAASNITRINMKNDATYSVTAAISFNANGGAFVQGYTTAFDDKGRAIIDGGTSGASYVVFSASNVASVVDLIIQNNGSTGSANGFQFGDAQGRAKALRCVVHDVCGSGLFGTSVAVTAVECEAYLCNKNNTANKAGFQDIGTAIRCISHDNAGNQSMGFYCTQLPVTLVNCIADTNGLYGFYGLNISAFALVNCDAYANGSDGIRVSSGTLRASIENCNLIQNGGWGINSASATASLSIRNCGFGAGTAANTSGTINTGTGTYDTIGSVTYGSNLTPWVDPANGDFRINLAAAINAGYGAYTQTQASYAGTVGYPDIGAAQHLESASGGGLLVNPGMRGGMI